MARLQCDRPLVQCMVTPQGWGIPKITGPMVLLSVKINNLTARYHSKKSLKTNMSISRRAMPKIYGCFAFQSALQAFMLCKSTSEYTTKFIAVTTMDQAIGKTLLPIYANRQDVGMLRLFPETGILELITRQY